MMAGRESRGLLALGCWRGRTINNVDRGGERLGGVEMEDVPIAEKFDDGFWFLVGTAGDGLIN